MITPALLGVSGSASPPPPQNERKEQTMTLHPTYDDLDRPAGAILIDDPSPYAWRWEHGRDPAGWLECGGSPVACPSPGINPSIDRLAAVAREISASVAADVSRRRGVA